MDKKSLKASYLLRPYWKRLAVALVAVVIEGAMDLLDPWPLKVVFDNVIGSKRPPHWLASIVVSTFGQGKMAILDFAALSVIAIAVLGALSSYTENY